MFCRYRVKTIAVAGKSAFPENCADLGQEPSGWIDVEAVRILVHDFPILRDIWGGREKDPHLQRLVR